MIYITAFCIMLKFDGITPEQCQVCNFDHFGVHELFWTDDHVISVWLIVYSMICTLW